MNFNDYYKSHKDIVVDALCTAYKKLFIDDFIEKPIFDNVPFVDAIQMSSRDFYYMLRRDYSNEFVKEVISILSKEPDFNIDDYSDSAITAISDLLETCRYRFESIESYQQIIVDYYAKNSSNEVNSIDNNDDNIGDTIPVSSLESVDIWNRDSAFIYLDGKVYKGEAGNSHAQLLNSIMDSDDFDFRRPESNEVLDKTNSNSVAFGSIIGNVGFLDTYENCSAEDVAKAAKQQLNLDKIYTYPDNNKITRLAKIQNRILAESDRSFCNIIDVSGCSSKFINIFKTVFCSQDVLKHISEEHMIQFTSPFSILEEFSNEYIQKLLDAFNKEFNANLSLTDDMDDINQLIDYMKDHAQLFDEEWNKATYNYSVDVLHDSINELEDKDDSIGDEVNFPRDAATIDVGTRDSAFVYINGEILIGNDKQTHGQLINEFFNCKEDEDSFYRTDAINKLNDNDKNSSFGFGHIIDSIAIIDNTEGCTQQEVAKVLLNYDSSISKVYFCPDESTLTRVAKNKTKQ